MLNCSAEFLSVHLPANLYLCLSMSVFMLNLGSAVCMHCRHESLTMLMHHQRLLLFPAAVKVLQGCKQACADG